MLINSSIIRPFTEEELDKVLPWIGIYALYEGNELIVYGKAIRYDVRNRLTLHYAKCVPCTKSATHFHVENTHDPHQLLVVRLEQFRRLHGRYPLCNRGHGTN